MPNDDHIERVLRGMPRAELGRERDAAILGALRRESAEVAMPWWARRIPLWQAAAACLAVAVLGLSAPRPFADLSSATRAGRSARPEPVVVRLDAPLIAPVIRAGADVSQWKLLSAEPRGEFP